MVDLLSESVEVLVTVSRVSSAMLVEVKTAGMVGATLLQ